MYTETRAEGPGTTDAVLSSFAAPVLPQGLAGASSDAADLAETARLVRSLLDRAEQIDDLWSAHGLDLLGFQGGLTSRFESVERAIAELIHVRSAGGTTRPSGMPPHGEQEVAPSRE